uniref:(California timema) hypothetical protein n=1 Tax=Timema californicum TaxID=61474 RepID=A0A7R9PCF4_TIMCA|nr:unnamed protein product [Timema californicum]
MPDTNINFNCSVKEDGALASARISSVTAGATETLDVLSQLPSTNSSETSATGKQIKETNDFDPEKFRQVNKKVKEDYHKQAVTQDDISYLPDLRKRIKPSLVTPTPILDYNISEENILNSIEEEYALNKNSFLNLSQK